MDTFIVVLINSLITDDPQIVLTGPIHKFIAS